MRIISKTKLRRFWEGNPDAETALRRWRAIVLAASWATPPDVKATFGKNVDFVEVESGNTVGVFNVHGNTYRLIAAIHHLPKFYKKGRVYVLRVMTHDEYDLNHWKEEL
jgi:mRNA interferase HigB